MAARAIKALPPPPASHWNFFNVKKSFFPLFFFPLRPELHPTASPRNGTAIQKGNFCGFPYS